MKKRKSWMGTSWFALAFLLSWHGEGNALAATRLGHSVASLAIDGAGWFIVRDPESNEQFVTRHGDFFLDEWGRFQNQEGYRVQGLVEASAGLVGDVQLDWSRANGPGEWSPIIAFWFRPDGTLLVRSADGTVATSGQILLQDFRQPENLVRVGLRIYGGMELSGPLAAPAPPGSPGLGLLQTSVVELEDVRWSLLPEAHRGDPLVSGALTVAGLPTDLGIRGEGFFLLRDPVTAGLFATRAGFFLRDGDGFLIHYTGLRVQGWTDGAMTRLGDVRIDGAEAPPVADPNAVMVSFSVSRRGRVVVQLSDGSQFVRGQVLLYSFQNPSLLAGNRAGLFSGVAEAGPFLAETLPAERAGRIHQGTLELIHATRELLAIRSGLSLFAQGALFRTRNPTDLALSGEGFFVVRDPAGGAVLATRNGAFHFDEAGWLVTREGWRVQGYADAGLSIFGDVRIDAQGAPSTAGPDVVVDSFVFDREGKLLIRLSDGTQFVRGQVLLQNFAQAYSLTRVGDGYFTNFGEARPLPEISVPGTLGLGMVIAEALELTTSPTPLVLPSRKGVRLFLTGEPGSRCVVEAKSGGKAWKALGAVTLGSNGEGEIANQRTRKIDKAEYRVTVFYPFPESIVEGR